MITTTLYTGKTVEPFRELADNIKKVAVVNGATIGEATPHGAFADNLPEGYKMSDVEAIAKYGQNFVQASRVAVAEISADMFIKDKELKTVTGSFGYFNKGDSVSVRATRHTTSRVPGAVGENEEPKYSERYMALTTDVVFRGQSGNTLRNVISEQSAGLFDK